MKINVTLDAKVLPFIVATRAMLAAGVGLLVSEKLSRKHRYLAAAALIGVGVATTYPAVQSVLKGLKKVKEEPNRHPQHNHF
jgi:hypothetical protein